MNQILIVEDDKDIRDSLHLLLESEQFSVLEASSGIEALNIFSSSVDLVIIDIMMPGISGIKTCEELRKQSFVPILFLTARSDETDKEAGFLAGGDDYLVKPYSSVELLARINALLRRHQLYDQESNRSLQKEKWIERHNISINTTKNQVYCEDTELHLTEMEYRILLLLMKYPNKIFSLANLYESVWNEPFFSASTNTIMVHIQRLRSKIEADPKHPKIVCTVWGKGYRLG